MLTEWETRRPYLATVCDECQLWKSAPDAAFESPIGVRRHRQEKKATLRPERLGKWCLK